MNQLHPGHHLLRSLPSGKRCINDTDCTDCSSFCLCIVFVPSLCISFACDSTHPQFLYRHLYKNNEAYLASSCFVSSVPFKNNKALTSFGQTCDMVYPRGLKVNHSGYNQKRRNDSCMSASSNVKRWPKKPIIGY